MKLLIVASALAAAGCSRSEQVPRQSSVTVKLPPARPYVPEPGFSPAAVTRARE